MPWNGCRLGYFRRPRVGSGTRVAAKRSVLWCVRGNAILSCLGISGVLVFGWVSQGRSPDLGRGKPESLEYHPLTSTVRKLKLNSQERGPRAQ